MNFSGADPTTDEVKGVKDFINSFLIGVKNYCLYPENHSISQKALANTAMCLEGFLNKFHELRLWIEKDRLVYKKEVVFQEPTGAENLATILFRDGIQWLQFSEGFGFEELSDFFRIFKEYKNWNEDALGDMVTALWEANLTNFKYLAVDVYWESEPLIDYSLLGTRTIEDFECFDPDPEVEQINSLPKLIADSGESLLKLTEEEEKILSKMVSDEERRDSLSDFLFVIFVLLKQEVKNNNLWPALELMEAELKRALMQGDFRSAYRLISELSKMRRISKEKQTWAMDDFHQFFSRISSTEILSVAFDNLRSIDELNSEDLNFFSQFVLLLDSKAIESLVPLLRETRSLTIRQQILQLISTLAERDIRPIERLISKANDKVVECLVPVLGQLPGERPFQLLLKLLKHQSGGVRNQAIKQFKDLKGEGIKRLFPLIEDPDELIRKMVLKLFGKDRNPVAEDLLLKYLERRHYTIASQQHLLACYHALGGCGSYRCIRFLQKVLFARAWFPDSGKSVHRIGATIALRALGTNEAKEILEKASRSFSPAVRLAYRKALKVNP
jgi:hypothetical protein